MQRAYGLFPPSARGMPFSQFRKSTFRANSIGFYREVRIVMDVSDRETEDEREIYFVPSKFLNCCGCAGSVSLRIVLLCFVVGSG